MSRHGENIHKRKDGRWEGRYIKEYDLNGKAKYGSVYSKSYLDVKRKLIEKKQAIITNALPKKDSDITLSEALYLWLDNSRLSLREQTYFKYKKLIDTQIIPDIGSMKVKSITAAHINRFLYIKTESGRLDGNGGLSASYVRTIAFILNSSLKFAAQEGYCNLIVGEISRPNKNKPTALNVLSVSEQQILEKYITENSDDKKLGALLSLYTGLRIGEVCALKWSDINFEEKTVHVQNTVSRIAVETDSDTKAKTKLQISDAKTYSSNRIIPIPTMLLELLSSLNDGTGEFVLKGTSHPYSDPRTLQYAFHKSLKECGLRDINFHALRHTFATRCIESGMDVKSLSEILGHSNVNITLNTYVHSSMSLKRKQLEAMISFCGHDNGQ